jgi:hypothetical protein
MDLGMAVLTPKMCLSCRICWGMMVGIPPDYIKEVTIIMGLESAAGIIKY